MASPAAPTQPSSQQQHRENGNRAKPENSHQGDQQFHKQNSRNPSHKKNYQEKARDSNAQEGGYHGQEPRGRGRREDYNNEANGSPRQEYRERRERKGGRNNRDSTANGNGNAQHTTKDAVEDPNASNSTTAANGVDLSIERHLIEEIQARYIHVPAEKITEIVRKNKYELEKCIHDLDNLGKPAWTAIVAKGKPAKSPVASPVAGTPPQPETAPPAPVGRKEKRRGTPHTEEEHHQHQQQAQPQQPQAQQAQPQQRRSQQQQQQQQQYQQRPAQQLYQHPQHQTHPQANFQYQQTYPQQPHQPQEQPQQIIHQEQLHHQQQIAEQQALQVYGGYPQFPAGPDPLLNISDYLEHQLAEVKKRTEALAYLKNEVDSIHNHDKEMRAQLEAKRAQLEIDRKSFQEQLRLIETELQQVEAAIRSSEEDKRRKVDDLYKNISNTLIPNTGRALTSG